MGNSQSTKIKFDDSVFPTGGGTIYLFDTTVACTGKRQLTGAGGGQKRFLWNIALDQPGSITLEKSSDRGAQWTVVGVAAPVVDGEDGGFLIQHYDDFRIGFTNGGVDQTVWRVDIALTGDRAVAGVAGDA